MGSTEPHYSPSKVFQSVMSRRPVFALLHRDSSAVSVLRAARAGQLVTLAESALPDAAALSAELEQFIFNNHYSERAVQWEALAKHSARESARILAAALDEAATRADKNG